MTKKNGRKTTKINIQQASKFAGKIFIIIQFILCASQFSHDFTPSPFVSLQLQRAASPVSCLGKSRQIRCDNCDILWYDMICHDVSQIVTTLIQKPSFHLFPTCQCSTHLELQRIMLHPILLSFPFLFVPEGLVMSFPTFLCNFSVQKGDLWWFDNSFHMFPHVSTSPAKTWMPSFLWALLASSMSHKFACSAMPPGKSYTEKRNKSSTPAVSLNFHILDS